MKKSIIGKGSSQRPGVLRPRNNEFTPNNRQSVGHPGRRSHVSKMAQADSAKRGSNRMVRGSMESALRPSLAASRFTPTRTSGQALSSLAPPSTSRMSTDTARSSGMGMSSRKDSRPITDPAFKSQCIDKILDFLRNGYEHPIQRRTLLTPSAKDFVNVFNFIYRHLDPSYVLPNRFEEEIPKLLKLLHYPVQMTKSSFVTVGSPHTWPAVLAMLAFLVDVVRSYNLMNHDTSSFSADFEPDGIERSRKLALFIKLYKCKEQDEVDSALEEYCQNLKLDEGVRPQDIIEIQEELEEKERELEDLINTPEELKQVQQLFAQYSSDKEKLGSYCQELKVAIQNKILGQKQLEQKESELHAEEIKVCEEVASLERLQTQQGLSSTDLARFKNHAQDVGRVIEQLEHQGEELQGQIWNTELSISKVHPNVADSKVKFESLIHQVGLADQCSNILSNPEDIIHTQADLMQHILAEKKKEKMATFQAQSREREKERELENCKELLQENQINGKKLEAKLRRKEEAFEITKEELAREEQQMMEENERLHQQAMEARKTHKKPLYQMQHMLEDKKRDLESCKKKEKEALLKGTEFLMKVSQTALQHVETQEHMIGEYAEHISKSCNTLEHHFRQLPKYSV